MNELYHVKTDKLAFDTDYVVEILRVNPHQNDWVNSSAEFTTPSCWNIPGIDIKKCRPLQLKNINSTARMQQPDFYQIHVTWDLPEHLPEYYTVTLNQYTENGYIEWIASQNISGSSSSADFINVNITSVRYAVKIISVSSTGETPNSPIDFDLRRVSLADNWTGKKWHFV